MTNEHFQKKVRELAATDEFNVDIFNLMKEKHEDLMKSDKDYLKTPEYFFLTEVFTETPDPQLRPYFRSEVLNTPVEPWVKEKKGLWAEIKSKLSK